MRRAIISGVWRLARAEGALLSFALIFVPYACFSRGVLPAIILALPIIPIAMCTFILNDINDIERDAINHPDRPLPSGSLSTGFAAALYLTLFATSLILVRALVAEGVQYVYLFGFLVAVNYATIVNHLPKLKTPYVAFASVIPFEIVNAAAGQRVVPYTFMAATFLFMLGREILMDIRDERGDGPTLAKALPANVSAAIAFGLQLTGITAMTALASAPTRIGSLVLIVGICGMTILLWRRGRQRLAINLMKAQMVLAIVLLT